MIRYTNSLGQVDDAVKRLEELNKWQEHQKKILQERQNKQLREFGIGKEIAFEMLGIAPLDDDFENKAGIANAPNPGIGESSGTCNEASKVIVTENASAMCSPKPKLKKQFLRRGEGLKKRFNIDPNDLRISNLPPYKYAKIHSSLSKNIKPHAPPKKVAKTIENLEEKDKELYNQERRFQQLFVSSNNIYNSTPDMKSNSNSTKTEIKLLRVNDKGEGFIKYSAKCDTISKNVINTNGPISWAKVLDTQQIKPISVQQIRSAHSSFEVQDSDENLSIFELLERKANEGSIDMNSSCIKRFMERKIQEDRDEIPVQSRLKTAGFLPNRAALESVMFADTDDNNDDNEDNASDGDQVVTNKLDSDCDSTLISQQIGPKQMTQVRFADVNNTHEYTEGPSDTSSTVTNISSSFELFEQFKQALFSAINCKELSPNESKLQLDLKVNQSASKLISVEDLQDVINLVKTRLSQLEKEIDTFKENNISLIKAKQQHEFEKTVFMQEQREAMNKLNDEKIQIEIYLHDERMKLEEEKRTFQRQMLMQKSSSNSKERKEIAKLKEELEEMAKQLKQKDQAHIAAQARLRAQIRNLEKDQRQLCEDIDRLEKENKHLQNENLRISRETNNKMLQEINRNIVKLAPKMVLKKSNENSSDYFKDNTEAKHKKCKMKPKSTLNKSTLLKTTKINQLASTSSSDCEENTNGAIISKQIRFRGENVPLSTLEQNGKDIAPHSVTEGSKEVSSLNDFKREIVNPDGSKDVWYSNGNIKKISSDGMLVRMLYFNKDIKETNINEGTVKYYYAETNTWHTSYLDGLEILEFPNGQTEHRYKNGVVEVHFPNNSVKISNPADEHTAEEWRFADGTNLKEMRNGDKILTLPNGQKEIHTKLNKRREYPDGTVKFVYPDGSQETRYSNGRVRLKDKDGQLIMDSENPQ